ncbi:hypothetical protein ATO6_12520 [Oceanicola sp. 22II-s10i]|uniref:TadG family pilus assembly protein n=1 Tax=Oceanicola sp. 22II-s10i TaxID=1317116 RepID=UPI000B522AE1|nr:TadG family pilus assembly protein [Oceanicola sp. 22II-s10i]OWU84503.1 hypothetical protein ATO6_12520 [Oceanicola sp. 22II-s10i]
MAEIPNRPAPAARGRPGWLRRFLRCERGDANLTMIYLLALLLVAGGTVLDLSNRARVQAILQASADTAAISGAIRLAEPQLGSSPRRAARDTVTSALTATHITGAWTNAGFELGRMAETGGYGFTPGNDDPNAVRVTLKRTIANGNPEPTALLRMVGIDSFDLTASSIARIKRKEMLPCTDPLLSLKTRLDLGQTDLFAGICLKASASVTYGLGETWLTAQAAEFVDGLIARAVGLDRKKPVDGLLHLAGLGGLTGTQQTVWETRNLAGDLKDLVGQVPNILSAALFDTYRLRAGESYHVTCDPDEVLRVRGPLVLDNVALYSDCPVEFDTDVEVRMSLILSNLAALLGNPLPLEPEPVISIRQGANCQPGDGARVFLFLDASVAAAIPALVDPASPLGGYLQEVWDTTGGLLGDTLDIVGPLAADLAETLTTTTNALGIAKLCLGQEIMLTRNTVQLR